MHKSQIGISENCMTLSRCDAFMVVMHASCDACTVAYIVPKTKGLVALLSKGVKEGDINQISIYNHQRQENLSFWDSKGKRCPNTRSELALGVLLNGNRVSFGRSTYYVIALLE
jgi:hypothetical protein